MSANGEIKSGKILIKKVFQKWYVIPEYQRPYVWGYDEIHCLLDDLTYAAVEKPNAEYFLGSFVYQFKPSSPEQGRSYDENDLLDGQQRLTTLMLMMAVIRDLGSDQHVKSTCQKCIYQEANPVLKEPELTRIVYKIRPIVQDFIDRYIKREGGVIEDEPIKKLAETSPDYSVRNMSNAVLNMKKYFKENSPIIPDLLLPFIVNNILMIYVSTENLEDAFRLFTILNDRGIPLRNSDILKSINIGALETQPEKEKYAKMWEEAEGELDDDFDRFLNHIRTILVKERPRLNLLREFEDKIYNPKEKDKVTQQPKPPLLKKGSKTFEYIGRYLGHYNTLLGGQNNYNIFSSFKFDNLIRVMSVGLPGTDWVPPLLRCFDKFGYIQLMEFLKKLDNKFSADLIAQKTPTDRIEAMNEVIKVIDSAGDIGEVLNSVCFKIDTDSFLNALEGPVYGKRYTKYIMLKLDYYYHNHDLKMNFDTLSVEHILPQNPANDSQWQKDFTIEQMEGWTHKLGNLILITRRKNTSLGNLDYKEKIKRYFEKNIDTCPNSLRVLQKYRHWTLHELSENHATVIERLKQKYQV